MRLLRIAVFFLALDCREVAWASGIIVIPSGLNEAYAGDRTGVERAQKYAEEFIRSFRKRKTGDVLEFMNLVRAYRLDHESLGISDEEDRQLYALARLRAVKEATQIFRHFKAKGGTIDALTEPEITSLRTLLMHFHLVPEAIGATAQDIILITRYEHILHAKRFLEGYRRDESASWLLVFMRDKINEAHITAAEIGISDTEFTQYMRVADVEEAKSALKAYRSMGEQRHIIELIRWFKKGITPEEIEMTPQELEMIQGICKP